MNERKIIKEFLEGKSCLDDAEDYSLNHVQGHTDHDLDPDGDGHITPEDLYSHFDLNNNGQVSTQEYIDHTKFHCAHPESLLHYNNARQQSIQNVPCKNSYDSCSQHLMGTPEDIDKFLKPLMDCTASSCKESTAKALLDVLQSLVKCGVIG